MFRLNTKLNQSNFTKILKGFPFTQVVAAIPTASKISGLDIILPVHKKANISITTTSTFQDVEKELKKSGNYETVEFRNWDNSSISKANEIKSCLDSENMFFMRINKMEWQLISKGENNPQDINSLSNSIFPTIDVNGKIDHVNELNNIIEVVKEMNKNNTLSEEEIRDISLQLFKIKDFYHNHDRIPAEYQNKSLSEIFEEYYKLKSEHARLYAIKEKLVRNSELKAKITILLGGLLFIGELILLYYGTFIKFSWDIAEPITYLVGCANLVLVLFFRKKLGTLSAIEYYTNKFYSRITKRKKFNDKLLDNIRFKIKDIERFLN